MNVELVARAAMPMLNDPAKSALLLDVDGVLAPIVNHPSESQVPLQVQRHLISLAQKYGLVACVSGRRAADARRLVGVGTMHYIGNHGGEIIPRGSARSQPLIDIDGWEDKVRTIVRKAWAKFDDRDLRGVWIEDKGPLQAIHWREAADQAKAHALVKQIGTFAEQLGLRAHEGRMVLELRPPVEINKGAAVKQLLAGKEMSNAMYLGDDLTDIDAFEALRDLVKEDALSRALSIAIADEHSDCPPRVEQAADMVLKGTPGVLQLLKELDRE